MTIEKTKERKPSERLTRDAGHFIIRADGEGESGKLRFVASDTSLDRYQTIVTQNWELSDFLRNPVFLWMHSHYRPPVGRVSDWQTDADGSKSIATVEPAETDFGQEVAGLYRSGMLNAVSVGFIGGDYWYDEVGTLHLGTPEDPNELLELSSVTVPGNGNALQLSASDPFAVLEQLNQDFKRVLAEMESIQRDTSRFDRLEKLLTQLGASAPSQPTSDLKII